ncbi:sigma-70 family RNA polymerase sigma factor [Clostridium boliviensis]|uniref:Sigma-70 family RNA polymerase sigma factor n=1 Tax=Clostridium boliviensis TaxID=318465 RepID=A0ABU4GHX2_9CLOT|nr:sigma-70 family RNA polymerase sigma factor [Clostridium boliviensis]MDW2797216.1 sigma-70 family RNA polymerase sigma factor [Clostridium boliviensis]
MAEKKEYRIKVQGQLMPVSEEIYLTYHRMKRRETYLEERDTTNGVFYYSALDTEGTNGEDVIPDLISPRVEEAVMDKLLSDKLHKCLAQLTKEELELILTLFFQNKSEHQLAAETGIPRITLHDRKTKILQTLKKLMEK